MILNGLKETIQYEKNLRSIIYNNDIYKNYQPHWHLELEVILMVKNCYDVIIQNEKYHLNEHDILLITPGTVHSINSPDIGERFIMLFDLSPLYQMDEFQTALNLIQPALQITHNNSIYPVIRSLLTNIVDEYNNNKILSEALIYSTLIQIFVNISRNEVYKRINQSDYHNIHHDYIEKLLYACNYIASHYNEDLSLEEVASVVGFSKFHFSRLFKKFTNTTFYNYLIAQRIYKAELMLANSDTKILDIAMSTGFNSISTFNRIFKSIKGCSPTDFRKSMNSNKHI